MDSFAEYKDAYENHWAQMEIRSSRLQEACNQANILLHGKPTYQQIESKTGVPWWFVGLCHYRESNFNFDTYLGNGQSLARMTTIVPKGRGPFTGPDAFTNGARDALRLEGFIGANDWGIARTLYRLEGFNGYGYHGKGVNSPYLYGVAARSISRRTCDESFAFDEKIRTITRHRSMASMIAAAYSRPGEMSRGATQQRIPAASSTAQAASAAVLSAVA